MGAEEWMFLDWMEDVEGLAAQRDNGRRAVRRALSEEAALEADGRAARSRDERSIVGVGGCGCIEEEGLIAEGGWN